MIEVRSYGSWITLAPHTARFRLPLLAHTRTWHKGDNAHISSFWGSFNFAFFSDTVKARYFKRRMIITLLGVDTFIMDSASRSQACQKFKVQIVFFLDSRLDSCVLYLKCYMVTTYIKKIAHNVNSATLACVQGIWFTCFWSVKCLYLSKTLTLGFSQIP